MSLIISIHVREGIVMASDSRMTLNTSEVIQGQSILNLGAGQSDSNYKTFLAPNNIGISTCGEASIEGVPIAGYIESFINEKLTENVREINEVPDLLLNYFQGLSKVPDTRFFIGGYLTEDCQRIQQLWEVTVKTGTINQINNPNDQGAAWRGEQDVLTRLVQPVWMKDADGGYYSLPTYDIPWSFFTLQDAIDFAVYAIRSTIESIRFLNRTKTVGGPIDVLVIKSNQAFWVKRKELKVNA